MIKSKKIKLISYFKIICMLSVIIQLIIFIGCKSPTDETEPTPPIVNGYGSISGTIVESLGSSPVPGSIVKIEDLSGFSGITDENGFFKIENIPAGYHNILVNKKGMAGSRIQNVYVWNDEITYVEIVQPEFDYSSELTTPPVISVSGIETAETYSGNVNINVSAQNGSCPVTATSDHDALYIKIGAYSDLYYDASSEDSLLSYSWLTEECGYGIVNIKLISYDINNNRSELNIPVYVDNQQGNPPAIKPLNIHYDITSYTYGNSLGLLRNFENRQAGRFYEPAMELMDQLECTTRSAENDSSIIIYIKASVLEDTTGICVYRLRPDNTGYVLAGKTSYIYNPTSRNIQYKLADTSSDISPGTVWYRIRYFNKYGNGPLSDPIKVTVLPRYNLFLSYPEDYSVINDPAPTLKWQADVIEDAVRYDSVYLWNFSTGETHVEWENIIDGCNEFSIFPLPNNCIYEWTVCSFYRKIGTSVLSYSIPSNDQSFFSSTNGAFHFTVIESGPD
jgi:hypothetical protein